MSNIYQEIQKRILVLDGAMGTMLQQYKFTEEDFRGERFKHYPTPLQGNNDLLSITQPEAVKEVHGFQPIKKPSSLSLGRSCSSVY